MKVRDIIQGDLSHDQVGHALQLLYACRLIKPSPSIQDGSGFGPFLDTLATGENPVVAEEARIILTKWKRQPGSQPGKEDGKRQRRDDGRTTRGKKVKTRYVAPMMNDGVSFEPPLAEEAAEKVSISVRLRNWGIKYHERDSFLYATSEQSVFILRGNTVAVSPAPEYAAFFAREKRLFEMCWQVYEISRHLAEKGEYLLYDTILGDIWNDNKSAEILLVEEDLIAEYPALRREMRSLDRMRGFPLNVNVFSVNEFMETLGSKHEAWKKNLENPNYLYALEDELEIAYYRGNLLETDEVVEERVTKGELPAVEGAQYPALTPCALSAEEWKWGLFLECHK